MVWEQNVSMIVMLCNLKENVKVKNFKNCKISKSNAVYLNTTKFNSMV